MYMACFPHTFHCIVYIFLRFSTLQYPWYRKRPAPIIEAKIMGYKRVFPRNKTHLNQLQRVEGIHQCHHRHNSQVFRDVFPFICRDYIFSNDITITNYCILMMLMFINTFMITIVYYYSYYHYLYYYFCFHCCS